MSASSPTRTVARLRPFGTTVFSEMTRLAEQHRAINLSQGFPDFDGPPALVEAARDALAAGHHQYARSAGAPALVEALAREQEQRLGLRYDAWEELVVTSGATEAIAAAVIGLAEPGDEVVLFEPYYDSYPATLAMAQAVPKVITLEFPEFEIRAADLDEAIGPRTRLLVLNTPHNPSGRVFSRVELERIAAACHQHDLYVIADEVYEHLTFGDSEHVSIASLPGMRERTLRISSAGKTFSSTGWKLGWAAGPRELVGAVQAAHQFLTFSTATPLQMALAQFLPTVTLEFFDEFRREYAERRDLLVEVLRDCGFRVAEPEGTYFVLADFSSLFDGDDRAFARHLIEAAGVAAIPPSAFYQRSPQAARSLVRFASCKRLETLESAGQRLREWAKRRSPA